MMKPIFIYDAFTQEKFGGNPAGIVLQAEELLSQEKQNLAKELGFSETVFISWTQEADWQFEYFTPKQEVDLCGHATIGAVYALFEEGELGEKEQITIKTRLGIFTIFLKARERITVCLDGTRPRKHFKRYLCFSRRNYGFFRLNNFRFSRGNWNDEGLFWLVGFNDTTSF